MTFEEREKRKADRQAAICVYNGWPTKASRTERDWVVAGDGFAFCATDIINRIRIRRLQLRSATANDAGGGGSGRKQKHKKVKAGHLFKNEKQEVLEMGRRCAFGNVEQSRSAKKRVIRMMTQIRRGANGMNASGSWLDRRREFTAQPRRTWFGDVTNESKKRKGKHERWIVQVAAFEDQIELIPNEKKRTISSLLPAQRIAHRKHSIKEKTWNTKTNPT